MKKAVQAKNISDAEVFSAIEKVNFRDDKRFPMASLWEIQRVLDKFPEKVVLAKLSSMVKRKALYGCPCGCRGDFTPDLSNYTTPERPSEAWKTWKEIT